LHQVRTGRPPRPLKNPKADGLCWNCRRPAAAEDNFCRFCGKSLTGFPWYYQHWGIILLSLLALGPFGLVLVWRSPVLSRAAQWAYTAVILLLTYRLVIICYRAWLLISGLLGGMMHGALPVGI